MEQIFKTTVYMQQKVDHGDIDEALAVSYRKILIRLGIKVHGQISSVSLVAKELVKPEMKGQQRHFIAAYNHFREANNIKEKLGIRRDNRRPLPILTPVAYFRIRYETGPRPCEPLEMRKMDIDFDHHLVRFGHQRKRGTPHSPNGLR